MTVLNAACALVAASPAANAGGLDTGYVRIGPGDLAWTLLLILCALVLSRVCRIGHEKSLLLGTVRSLVQLLAVGWLLRLIFRNEHWTFVVLMVVVMIAIAAFDGKRRLEYRFRRALPVMLESIGLATLATMATAIFLVFPAELWVKPQYVIPLAGMMTANALNSASLAVNRLAADVRLRKGEIEAALSLGATPAQAAQRALRAAVRAAMTPALNMMMIVGIVQIPGMMSGQIIAGTDPIQAVMYQLMVIYMIAATTTISSLVAAVLTRRALFTSRHQLVPAQDCASPS